MLLMAQGQGVQIAPKGGIAMWKGSGVKSSLAPVGGLELGYTARWSVMRDVHMGFRLGAGASYAAPQLTADLQDQYDKQDYMGLQLQYTNTANVKEKHQQLNVEVPVLFAFEAHGFAINIGPKLLVVMSDKYTQTVNSANIDVYFPEYKVTVHNEAPTGLLQTPYERSGNNTLPKLSVLLSAEVGYEWAVGNRYSRKNEQYIGVQLYVDYGLWNQRPTETAFLDVAPITGPYQQPTVTVGTIPAAQKLNYLSAGLRFYYTIQTVDYSGRGWHRLRR